MTTLTVDVAIVGAGPGGSTLAALLARRGYSVALIDRDDFPRDKLCGEFLSYDALPIAEALGIDLGDAPYIEHCRVVGRGRTYAFDFPHPARGVSRVFLDDALHRCAVAAGSCPASRSPITLAIGGGSVAAEVSLCKRPRFKSRTRQNGSSRSTGCATAISRQPRDEPEIFPTIGSSIFSEQRAGKPGCECLEHVSSSARGE